jgi:hypothetical protein
MDRMDASSNATRQGAESLDNIMIYPIGLLMGKVKRITDKGIPVNRMTYTKHYYIGAERVSAKTGTMADLGLFPNGFINQTNTGLTEIDTAVIKGASRLAITDAEVILKKVYTTFLQTPPVLSWKREGDLNNTNHNGQNLNIYYFHPDHLGSSSYITNGLGNVIQHIGRK